jgi:2-keto-4-pentenoate hydratase
MDELAQLLTVLRREGRQQSGLDARLVPEDSESAYQIAHTVTKALGWPIAGWKVGPTKPAMQRMLRSNAPTYGPLFERFVGASPAVLSFPTLLNPLVEIEYVAKLGRSLPPRENAYLFDEVSEAVASLHPALEIAETRYRHDKHLPPLAAILADGAGSGHLVFGPPIRDWRTQDIEARECVLRIDGVEQRKGTAAETIDHPVAPLTWLANELSGCGLGLLKGQLVSTGTLAAWVVPKPGEEYVADFGCLGRACVTFAP